MEAQSYKGSFVSLGYVWNCDFVHKKV